MTNSWKVLATFLLCNLAMAAWAADAKRERRGVPLEINDNGVLLDVRGVFEIKELAGHLIVLYQDPADGSFGYSLQEGPTTGEDVLDLGDVKLVVTFADGGGLKTVEVWENDTWSTVGELGAKAIKGELGAKATEKGLRPLPDFDEVPIAKRPCKESTYLYSGWTKNGCLWDYFHCPDEDIGWLPGPACCDDPPENSGIPDCQGFDVPLPTANQSSDPQIPGHP
jgi:hypothetical protein